MNLILIIHAVSCWFMTGVIWLVQLLIYPNFRIVGETHFQIFHKFHMQRITWVVAPFMFLELVSAAGLVFLASTWALIINLVLVLMLWALTALVNVPTHNALRFESITSKSKLVLHNWPRTLIWTGRSAFLLWMIYLHLEGAIK